MPTSVTMPRLGESVSEGTVTRWLKSEGERVEVDEPLLEVSTDKVDTEIPSPVAGVLQRIVVSEDSTVEVGAELAVIDDGADASGDSGGDSGGGTDAAGDADGQAAAEPDAQPADAEATDGQATDGQPSGETADDARAEAAQDAEPAQDDAAQQPASGDGQPAAEPRTDDQPQGESSPPSDGAGGTPVRMPALGESVTEGTVTRWLKQVGDRVEADEPLVEVSTDKVDTEIPSPVAGTLVAITADTDATVEVGGELAVIDETGAPAGQSGGGSPAAPAERDQASTADQAPSGDAPSGDGRRGGADQAVSDQTPSSPAGSERADASAKAAEPAPPAAARQRSQAQPTEAVAAQPKPAPGQAGGQAPQGEATPQRSGDAGADGQATYATPLVRKLASQHGIDLAMLRGTGVGGRIRKQDILDAAARREAESKAAKPATTPATAPKPAAAPSPLRGTTEKMSRLRAVIARRMVESLQTSAQLTTVVEVDVTRVARLRQQAKEQFLARHGVKLSFLPFFAVAAVEALQAHPRINATVDLEAGTITYPAAEHLGIAVDTERGLLVPVIRDAGDLNLGGMARKIADLAERTRANKVSPDELSGGTFTLTNTGSRGALFDTPIINQPQSAILGTGAVVKRAVVVDDPDLGEVIAPRSTVYLALSYDHRIVDGADAARFLVAVKERLEAGAFETDLGLD